nr:MAG TPA: hypothetical protein [Caudoviricetes sp.]DAR74249.1 MAG TPA: hypothetical protein [Caudoviricetes sp.]
MFKHEFIILFMLKNTLNNFAYLFKNKYFSPAN